MKTNEFAFASRSKAKAKQRRHTSACSFTKTVPIRERNWIDIEPGAQFDQACPVAKRLNTLLRHGELPREENGAVECWTLKVDLRNKFKHSQHWCDEMWKSKMAGGGGNKKIFQYCTDPSRQGIFCFRALLTGIHTYTDLRGAQVRARRGGKHAVCVSGQHMTMSVDVE